MIKTEKTLIFYHELVRKEDTIYSFKGENGEILELFEFTIGILQIDSFLIPIKAVISSEGNINHISEKLPKLVV